MKFKIRFNPEAIKQFFLDHFEKVLFGAVVLCFLLFVYSTVARNTLGWGPEDLASDIEKAKRNIEATQPTQPPIKKYAEIADDFRKPVPEAEYTFKAAWEPSKFPEGNPRGMPKFYPAKDLQVDAGHGAFAMIPFDVGSAPSAAPVIRTHGQRWAVVTGLIQYRDQKKAYDAVFRDAAQWDPRHDSPIYVFCRVDRAEIDPGKPSAELTWKRLNTRAMLDLQKQWTQTAPELVDAKFLPQGKTGPAAYPLGPLVNRAWGPEVAHEPQIPVRSEPIKAVAATIQPAGAAKGAPSAAELAKADESRKRALAEKAAPAKAADLPDEPDEEMLSARPIPTPATTAGTPHPANLTPGTGPGDGNAAKAAAETPENEVTEFCLFRFFDFTVEAGKQYRYRVQLSLANPNFGLPARLVKDPKTLANKWLDTTWSEPSPPVSVPLDSQILLVSGKASDGTADVLLTRFDAIDGMVTSRVFDSVRDAVQRGKLLNFKGVNSTVVGTSRAVADKGTPELAIPKSKTVDYLSQALVLDVAGGGRLPGKDKLLTEPVSLLLLDAQGNLVVHNELDDLPQARLYGAGARAPAAAAPVKKAAPATISFGGFKIKLSDPRVKKFMKGSAPPKTPAKKGSVSDLDDAKSKKKASN